MEDHKVLHAVTIPVESLSQVYRYPAIHVVRLFVNEMVALFVGTETGMEGVTSGAAGSVVAETEIVVLLGTPSAFKDSATNE